MRRFLTLFTMLMLCGVLAFAQSRVVTGRVTDQNGAGVPFATVTETGTKNTVSADGNGNYQIRVTGNPSLSITAAGYKPSTATIVGNTAISSMELSGAQLEEVVVTALGIQRQRKDLGYATAQVKSEELTQSAPINVANGLQGKVSGLNVTSVNNGVFEDVKINLRGIRSLLGNNNPMLLLDGVQTDLNLLSSINPQDIQDVTVLKGASGAGIYGPDARNGVIVVTTKRGGSRVTPTITVSRTTQFSSISKFPKFQNEFGSGGDGQYISYENWSWGPAFDGSMVPLGDPLVDGTQQMVPYVANNSRREFWNTGITNQTDVSLAVKELFLSVQDANITGIVPGDKNRRTSLRLNADKTYGKIKAGVSLNYVQQNYDVFNDAAMGAYNAANNVGLNDGLLNLIFNTPAHVPITSYKDFKNNPFGKYDTYFNHYGLNPYVALDNWRQEGVRDDIIANLDLTFQATKSLSFTWRVAGTFRNNNATSISKGQTTSPATNANTNTAIPGSVNESTSRTSRLSSDLFARWDTRIKDFKIGVVAGTYLRDQKGKSFNIGNSGSIVPGLYDITNFTNGITGDNNLSRSRTTSAYGSIDIGYKGWANVQFTGRNDWASVFAYENRSFFYPSVNASLVLSDAIPSIKSGAISFLKVSAAIGKTANADIAPYQLESTYSGTGAGFPYNVPGLTAQNTNYDPLLKPEFIKSKDVGLQVGFLKDKIILELAAYTQDNTNQIIPVQISNTTGYTSTFVNAASFVNKGVEVDLKINRLVKIGDLSINYKINGSYNTSEVKSIFGEDLKRLQIGGFGNAANFAIVNNPAFVFMASDYARDAEGRVIVDRVSGLPTTDPVLKQYGRTAPLWIVGMTPEISFKSLTLSIVGEYRGGHMAYSGIGGAMAWTGVSAATAENHRERFVIPNSVYDDGTGKMVPNTNVTINNVNNYFTNVYRSTAKNFLHSAESWRIREVSLGYDLPMSMLGNQKFFKGLNVTLNARNLFLWVPKSNQFTDPDFNFTTGNTSGVSTSQINPPTRMIGINVTAIF